MATAFKEESLEHKRFYNRLYEIMSKAKRDKYEIKLNIDFFKRVSLEDLAHDGEYSLKDIAAICDTSPQGVNKWVNPQYYHYPKISALVRLAEAFNITPQFILGLDDAVTPEAQSEVAVFEKYGLSKEAYYNLKKMKECGVDCNELVSGINCVLSHTDNSDSPDNLRENWLITLNALSNYMKIRTSNEVYCSLEDFEEAMGQLWYEAHVRNLALGESDKKRYEAYLVEFTYRDDEFKKYRPQTPLTEEEFKAFINTESNQLIVDIANSIHILRQESPVDTEMKNFLVLENYLKQCKGAHIERYIKHMEEQDNITGWDTVRAFIDEDLDAPLKILDGYYNSNKKID